MYVPFPRCQVQGGAVVAEEVRSNVDLWVLAMVTYEIGGNLASGKWQLFLSPLT